ncbi:hypothetical protein BLA15945_03475 [Burkholderia lata]|uniref:Lipoprotein n=2 Tax=Burkholderia lata (strain ATCC 17760 / DSM 23089 / LMG 22485 / NCIMB 9086 / R18194 / 383) TaxID=482957 RepID=A0A6P2M014_BURL3|nr:hypothetical protein BLA15945_03475 [Burkholderia lata]
MKSLIWVCSAVIALTACSESDQSSTVSPASSPNAPAVSAVSAQPQSVDVWVDLKPETFRKQYDELATADGGDTIRRMSKAKDGIEVTLNDKKFQRGIAELKKLDLANGHFESQLGIHLYVNSADQITRIGVVGDRSDPVNLMHFVGAVGIVNNMLNPGSDKKANTDFLASLSLMRGDTDASIGQPISAFNHGGAFACISVPSEQSTSVACVVTPRS